MMAGNTRFPALFIGHGSPMNAVENNEYSRKWAEIAGLFPKPKAVLSISAHWYTNGTRINDMPHPKIIYDFYGFPEALYQVQYPADGSPELAKSAIGSIQRPVTVDHDWGIDHGTWSVLSKMYPQADIPVVQLSIDRNAGAEESFQIGRDLRVLRDKGVLILGSGNVVHNLSQVAWDLAGGYPWADEFDQYVKQNVIGKRYEELIHYHHAGKSAERAFTTPEHFYPLLYVLGASHESDALKIVNDSRAMGSLSMTSYLFC